MNPHKEQDLALLKREIVDVTKSEIKGLKKDEQYQYDRDLVRFVTSCLLRMFAPIVSWCTNLLVKYVRSTISVKLVDRLNFDTLNINAV